MKKYGGNEMNIMELEEKKVKKKQKSLKISKLM